MSPSTQALTDSPPLGLSHWHACAFIWMVLLNIDLCPSVSPSVEDLQVCGPLYLNCNDPLPSQTMSCWAQQASADYFHWLTVFLPPNSCNLSEEPRTWQTSTQNLPYYLKCLPVHDEGTVCCLEASERDRCCCSVCCKLPVLSKVNHFDASAVESCKPTTAQACGFVTTEKTCLTGACSSWSWCHQWEPSYKKSRINQCFFVLLYFMNDWTGVRWNHRNWYI